MVLRSPSHPNRKGGKPESLSPEPLFSKTGTQGDTLPPSSGTVARLGASWVAGSGVLAGGAAAPGGPPCPSSACYLASGPQGPGWDLPQVGGRVGEQRPRCVGEGSEWGQLVLRPGPALAPDVRGTVSQPSQAQLSDNTTAPVMFLLREPPSPPLGTKPKQTRHAAHSPRPGYGGPGLCQLSPSSSGLGWFVENPPEAPSALSEESKE